MSSAAEVLLASLQQTQIISLQEPFPILSALISLNTFLKAEFTQRFKRFANKSLQLNKAFVLFFIQEKMKENARIYRLIVCILLNKLS